MGCGGGKIAQRNSSRIHFHAGLLHLLVGAMLEGKDNHNKKKTNPSLNTQSGYDSEVAHSRSSTDEGNEGNKFYDDIAMCQHKEEWITQCWERSTAL